MDKKQLRFFSKELKKEAAFPDILDLVSNLDPASTAAALAMAKINLMNRYGDKIPVLKDVMGTHYKGMMHSGLMTGLRGEKGTSEVTKGLTAAMDSNTPGVYDKALSVGRALRDQGISHADLSIGSDELIKKLKSEDFGIEVDRDMVDSIINPKRGLNRIYDRLGQPVRGSIT